MVVGGLVGGGVVGGGATGAGCVVGGGGTEVCVHRAVHMESPASTYVSPAPTSVERQRHPANSVPNGAVQGEAVVGRTTVERRSPDWSTGAEPDPSPQENTTV
jgi:hypothetical protein